MPVSATAADGLMPAPFASEKIDGMRCGTIELSVPLRDDVIQVGAGGDVDVGRLRVVRTARTLVVTRVDGRPIQVVVVTDDPERVAAPDYRPRTASVFVAPVAALRLVRVRDRSGRARWCPVNGRVPVRHRGGVKQFVDVIGTFAQAKQKREAPVSAFTPRMA